MLIANGFSADGRNRLIIGLSEGNMIRLRNDEPIQRPLDGDGASGPAIPGLEGWDLIILGPEDTVRFIAGAGGDPARLGP